MYNIEDNLESAFCDTTKALRNNGYTLADTRGLPVGDVGELDHRLFGILLSESHEATSVLGIHVGGGPSYSNIGTLQLSDSLDDAFWTLATEWILTLADNRHEDKIRGIIGPISKEYNASLR